MRLITATLLLILLSVYPPYAFADGNKLITDCKVAVEIQDAGTNPTRNWLGVGYCLGRIEGISDLNSIVAARDPNAAMFCKPSGVTTGQMARVVTRYLEDNPDKLHMKSSFLVVLALSAAYPCEDWR